MSIKKWHEMSIQTLIATSFSIAIVFVIMIIGIISFFITSRTVDENTNEYVLQIMNQINYDIEYYLKNIENSLDTLKANDDIYQFFEGGSNPDVNDAEMEQMLLTIPDMLNDYLVSRVDAVNVILIRKDGQVIVNEGNYQLKDSLDIEKSRKDAGLEYLSQGEILSSYGMSISNAHVQNIIVGRYKWVVSCSIPIIDRISGDLLGAAIIDLNFKLIEDMLNNVRLGEKGYMFIVDDQGSIVYHPKHELIYSGIKDESIDVLLQSQDGYASTIEDNRQKNYIISTSSYSGWKVVGAVYEDELNPYNDVTRQIYTILIGLSIVIAILIAIIISRSFLHPIKDLNDAMHQFKNGDLETLVDIKQGNEFGELAETFNDMTKQIKQLVDSNQEAEKAKRRYELKSLQAQINPHFLYNTLDSIVWMAEAEMNREVVEMTDSLAKLFRISINRGSEFVTVAKELEHIESYLIIQKLRYGDKLDYEIKADDSILSCRVVKIIIQPIVENAIYHGIKKLASKGKIWIEAQDKGEDIKIIVKDNGVGMDQEAIRKVLNPDANHSISKGGIGVVNVDQRIKLYYGSEYGIDIESEVFEGTQVTLTLPKVYVKEDGHEEEQP